MSDTPVTPDPAAPLPDYAFCTPGRIVLVHNLGPAPRVAVSLDSDTHPTLFLFPTGWSGNPACEIIRSIPHASARARLSEVCWGFPPRV